MQQPACFSALPTCSPPALLPGPRCRRPPFDNRVDAPIRAMARVGSNDFLGPGGERSFRPGGRPAPQRGAER